MKLKIEYKKVEDLAPYELNSRTHSEEQVVQIANSIKEFGFTNPILLDGDNGILAGHGRLAASKLLEMKEVPTIQLSGLSEDQKRAYVIADNKIALNAGWDNDILKLEITDLMDAKYDVSLIGFDDKEVLKLFDDEKDTVVGEIKFSEELLESHNYVVLYFDNDIDWLSAKSHFQLDSVYSKRANGKPWSKGTGRVVHGGEYLTRLGGENV
jgi:ParB-like chromosome segregation protein Spo0J